MTLPIDPGDILDAASKIVELPGVWRRGSLGCNDVHGEPIAACAIGAIYHAAVGRVVAPEIGTLQDRATILAVQALGHHVEDSVIRWNDTMERTAGEVATAMREAAAEWRRHQPLPPPF